MPVFMPRTLSQSSIHRTCAGPAHLKMRLASHASVLSALLGVCVGLLLTLAVRSEFESLKAELTALRATMSNYAKDLQIPYLSSSAEIMPSEAPTSSGRIGTASPNSFCAV